MNMKRKFKFKKHKTNKIYNKSIYINNFLYLFDILLFLLILGLYNSSEIFFNYPQSITLLNGNIFIIHQKGIDIYDSNLTNKIGESITFDDADIINDNKMLSKTTISRFSEDDNGYIICIIYDRIYIFNKEGKKLYSSKNKIAELQSDYYTLVAIKKESNKYSYVIGYIDENQYIKLLFFTYNEDNNTNECINIIPIYDETKKILNRGLSCQLMNHPLKGKILVCFYSLKGSPNNIFTFFLINLETQSIVIDPREKGSIQLSVNENGIKWIKSAVNIDYKKAFICFYSSSLGYCTSYSINDNTFSKIIKYSDNCRDSYFGLNVNYFRETENFVFSCSNNFGKIKTIFFDNNLEIINSFNIFESHCKKINGFSIVYSKNRKYFLISDDNCYKEEIFFFKNISKYKEKKELVRILNECPEKCSNCDEQVSKNLCTQCNTKKNYYRINPQFKMKDSNNDHFDCYNNSTKPKNFFFNKNTNFYEPCYKTCATCEYGGDGNENNCTSCDYDYMKEPEVEGTKNCVVMCKNFYYYTSYRQFKCSSSPQCPEENNLLIRDKRKCVKSCQIEEGYPYQYNGECLNKCPNDTITPTDSKDHICKLINKESCSKSTSEFELYNFLKEGGVEKIAKTYAKEFIYTDKHISIFKNEVYSIMIYKDKDCITELELPMPEIDFGTCYTKVQNSIGIDKSLIVAIIDKSSNKKSNPITSYSFYNPINGEKIDSETLCKEEVIVVKENIKSLLNETTSNIDSIIFLADQNINVFNKSCEFYTDLCYHFESPNNKDVPLKDRLLVYYPNITLCDSGCTIYGVNLTSMTAICECKYKEMTEDDNEEESNLYESAVNEVFNILDQINLAVMACYSDLFEYKYFISCYGGIIILCLIVVQIINIFIYYFSSVFSINKFIFNMSENYILFLNKSPMYKNNVNKIKKDENNKDENENENEKENAPPKKHLTSSAKGLSKIKLSKEKKPAEKTKKIDGKKKRLRTQESIEKKVNNKLILGEQKPNQKKKRLKSNSNNSVNLDKSLISFKSNDKANINTNPLLKNNNTNNNKLSFFDIYLSTHLNEMRFNDAMIKDKRLFFDYFCDKLKKKQVILELFLVDDPLKPKTLKVLLLILDIEICFCVNAMFINEDYVSKIFHSTKEENFISFLPRSIDRSIFTILASFTIKYIVGCLFIDERRIKNILRYERRNMNALKYEISLVMKEIKWRYSIFILITIIISFFSWFYISCFNNIYPHTKMEWIKSSIFIILSIYIISILFTLIETLLRFVSFEIKSERMYRASLWLS